VSELRDRLEALAARGTHRGADDVLNAARRDAQSGVVDQASNGDEADLPDMPMADDELPLVTLEPGRRGRRRFGSFVAAAGIAALVGVTALAVTAMFGSGGADSPEGAVRQLADAITHKDPLAAVDVLVPSEVRSLRETVHAATQRAADLKIVNEASQPLAGVDLSVDHLQLSSESLADGYAKVTITSGEISASSHRAQLSALLRNAFRIGGGDAQGQADLSKIAASQNLPTFVVVVRQDGRWYVSPAYTAFEYVREINGDPAADFGSANPAQLGSATPESAVADALHAAQAGNWDRLFALAPPDELPLYDYRAMLDNETATANQPDFTIGDLSTTASVDGDTATVELTASGTFGSDHSKWQLGGTCPSQTASAGSVSNGGFSLSSGSGGSVGQVGVTGSSSWCFSGDVGAELPFSLRVFPNSGETMPSGPVSISVVREGGRWFVSPVTTVLKVVDSAIEHVDQRTVYTFLGLAYELPPDGTVKLDQPFQVSAAKSVLASQVYAFDGKSGERVVGEASLPAASPYAPSASGTIFTAGGDFVGQVDFQHLPANSHVIAFVSSAKLPVTGSYRLVMQPFAGTDRNMSLTLWDLANAPKSLSDAVDSHSYSAGGQSCTYKPGLGGGTESCTAVAVPTTAFPTSGTTAESGQNGGGVIKGPASSAVTATTSSTSGP
jgi:hypothetical protein